MRLREQPYKMNEFASRVTVVRTVQSMPGFTPRANIVEMHVALRRGQEMIGGLSAGYRDPQKIFTTQQKRIAHSIGQLTVMAIENARLVEALAQLDRPKSNFLAAISHELRTPLHITMGYTMLLLEGAFWRAHT